MPARSAFCSLLAACASLGATACGRNVYLGNLGDGGGSALLWQATFDRGDLSEWLDDGNGGVYMDGWTAPPAASATYARGGRFGGVATITQGAVTSFSYLYREQPSPPEAYYGAWFFIPATVQVGSWLSLHHFGYHPAAGSATTTPLWDFHVYYPTTGGSLAARLYDATNLRNLEQTNPVAVPLATWVHFEILLRKATDATGRIVVWQDGVQILDWANLLTAPTDWVQWDVGAGSNDFAPSPASVFLDDATISLARVGI